MSKSELLKILNTELLCSKLYNEGIVCLASVLGLLDLRDMTGRETRENALGSSFW